MNIVQKILEVHNEKVKQRNKKCGELISLISDAISEVTLLFENKQDFIEPSIVVKWHSSHNNLINELNSNTIKKLKGAKYYKKLLLKQSELNEFRFSLKNQISNHNEQVANGRIPNAYELIGEVEGRKLDKQQMACIVKEAHNHLVIAGAGTGKTTTVVGKIKYLLKTYKYAPEDILVLSFTNASATEMSERIAKETGCNIEASTFHKLGLNIITKVNDCVPKITQLNLRKFVKEQLQINMQSDVYLNKLSSYLLYNKVVAKSEFDFKTQGEYEEYLHLNPPTTIKNEQVKSYGEMDIANFLMQNGVEYVYEKPYAVDTRASEYGEYKPDFYLPEYDIYIEYFAINKKGEVPTYFKGRNGKSATQAYQESMEWKRQTHKSNSTRMIECYAYEKFDGILLDSLKKKLESNSVVLKPKTAKELWEQVASEGESVLDGLIELFETVINLIKSNAYTIEEVRKLNVNNSNIRTNDVILYLIEPIFNAYCSYLKENEQIDFNDMINLAKQYVEEGKFVSPYKYVIVDEYQDISKARFTLLESMRKTNYFDLFCVGDDWQSIYRFAGSDIGFILNFERYWGSTEISKIETTYRFSKQLIEISGNFIMQNPEQIKKSTIGKSADTGFALGEISGYADKYAVEFMLKKLDDLPKNSSVFFIGRYSFEAKILSDNGLLGCQYNNQTGVVEVKYRKRLDLKMSFITAHKSKGLQADYVFIINNKKSRMGFPSKIQDAAILELLLENCDKYPNAEERRLFYVALTRAKVKTYIVTVEGQESEFAMELKRRYSEELRREKFTCPWCGGRLLKRNGQYGEFFGCENYKTTGCKYTRKI